ncbi:MAG: ATP-binding protein [Desulfobulbaceae bacterium]|nr:MAG: ATP-binding protein [Desulfobulbaceae bacterium]
MSITSLLFSGPKNIRRRLFRDIIIIILVSISGIAALVTYQGQTIKDEVSAELIGEVSELVRNRFVNYLSPVETSLKVFAGVMASMGGGINDDRQLKKLLAPFLDVFADVTHVTISDEHGNFAEFQRVDGDYHYHTSTDKKKVFFHLAPPENGLAAPEKSPVYWGYSASAHPSSAGLTVSIKVRGTNDDEHLVVTFFIPSTKIIKFISAIEIHQNIDIVLFDAEKQRSSGGAEPVEQREALQSLNQTTTRASRADVAGKALALWDHNQSSQPSRKFKTAGSSWWVGYTKLRDTDDTWLAIIVPDSAILKDVYRQWLQLATISGVILLLAAVLTLNLVRKYSFLLKDLPQQDMIRSDLTSSVQKLIKGGESTLLEFKSTLRKNIKTGKAGKEIEIAWLKTVAAFMNSDGGILLIGINDDGEVIGTEADEFESEDKCRLHFRNCIHTHIGAEFSKYVHLKICQIEEKTVLVIECERVRRPVFLRIGKTEDFYMRSGPASMKLTMSQMITYLSER